MKEIICPECSKIIPEYRLEDPYCDCGWEPLKKEDSFDTVGWILSFCYLFAACVVQLVVIFILHQLGSWALSFIANILAAFIPDLIGIVFYFLFILLDFIVLSLIYACCVYLMAKKSSRPILYSVFIGIILVGFKVLLMDPVINNPFPVMVWVQNLLLLGMTVAAGWFISYSNKLVLDRLKSCGEVS